MDYNPDAAANNPWCYYHNDDDGAAPPVATAAAAPTSDAGDTGSSFQFGDMIADYSTSTDDLFELVWGQGGGSGAGGGGAPAVSRLCSPRFELDPAPPSEGEMAAWLREIDQTGEGLPCDDGGGHRDDQMEDGDGRQPVAKGGSTSTGDSRNKNEKRPTTREGAIRAKEMRKPPAGGSSSRRSHHGEAHNLTEKRRRHKINERLRALQHIVPGCDKSNNQASTLDRTIRYMKSLQDQVHAMSVGPAAVPAAAVYPVVPPRSYVPPGPGAAPVAVPTIPAPVVLAAGHHIPTTASFRAMLHLPYYPAAAVAMQAADALPLYRYPAAAAAAAPPRDADAVAVVSGAGDAAVNAGRPSSSARIKQQRSS